LIDKKDRLGRSLRNLLETIERLEATGVDLYFDQQNGGSP
jgi:DNA invertase Pin-like site-specific DNA recombinase